MINHAKQGLEYELGRRLSAGEQELRAMKNRQFLGADSLTLLASEFQSLTIPSLAPGAQFVYILNFYGSIHQLYNSELGLGFYIDVDNDPAHWWPGGSYFNADPEKFAFEASAYYDAVYSDEAASGLKRYILRIKNTGTTANKAIYAKHQLIFPAQAIS